MWYVWGQGKVRARGGGVFMGFDREQLRKTGFELGGDNLVELLGIVRNLVDVTIC